MGNLKKVCIRMGPEYQAIDKYVNHINCVLKLDDRKKWTTNSFMREVVLRYGARLEDDLIKEAGS